jgi:hypothetical protein
MFFYGDGNLMLYFSMYSLYQWLEYGGIQNIVIMLCGKLIYHLRLKILFG